MTTTSSHQELAPRVRDRDPHFDRRLVERVADGDEDALVSLFDAHRSRAFAIAMRVLRDPWEAEDAVQETFIQVWTRPGAYDPARGEVAGWLALIARSRALDRLRRRQRRPPPSGVSAGGFIHPDQGLCMKEALEELTEPQRRVLELAFYDGLTQTEIARRLELPLGTVKGRMRSGIIRLRECLDGSAR